METAVLNSDLGSSTIQMLHLQTNESLKIPARCSFLLVAGRSINAITMGLYSGSTNGSTIYNFTTIKAAEGSTLSVKGLDIEVSLTSGAFDGFLIIVK